jgi:hypothetical protein
LFKEPTWRSLQVKLPVPSPRHTRFGFGTPGTESDAKTASRSPSFEADQNPIVVVVDRAWRTFDPREHAYAIIWLSDFAENAGEIPKVLHELARRAKQGDDVIGYLRDVAEAAQLDEHIGRLARLASYFEVKPSVFGVSIDVKAILSDLSKRP